MKALNVWQIVKRVAWFCAQGLGSGVVIGAVEGLCLGVLFTCLPPGPMFAWVEHIPFVAFYGGCLGAASGTVAFALAGLRSVLSNPMGIGWQSAPERRQALRRWRSMAWSTWLVSWAGLLSGAVSGALLGHLLMHEGLVFAVPPFDPFNMVAAGWYYGGAFGFCGGMLLGALSFRISAITRRWRLQAMRHHLSGALLRWLRWIGSGVILSLLSGLVVGGLCGAFCGVVLAENDSAPYICWENALPCGLFGAALGVIEGVLTGTLAFTLASLIRARRPGALAQRRLGRVARSAFALGALGALIGAILGMLVCYWTASPPPLTLHLVRTTLFHGFFIGSQLGFILGLFTGALAPNWGRLLTHRIHDSPGQQAFCV